MKKNKILSAVLISANVFSLAAPAVVHAADQNNSAAATAQSSTVKKDDKNAKSDKATTDANKDSDQKADAKDSKDAKKETVKNTDQSTIKIENNNHDGKDDPDNPQNLKEQTMILRKVIATSEKDLSSDSLKGINGAKFTVYDVTDLMNTIIKEKLKVDDSNPTDEQIDKALDEANNSDFQEFDKNATDETDSKQSSTSKDSSSSKKDESKIPPVYKSVKSADSEKSKSEATGKPSSQAPSADTNEDKAKSASSSEEKKSSSKSQNDKSTAQSKNEKDDKDKKSDESKSERKSDSKSDSSTEKEEDTDSALIEQVEEMRKDDTLRKEISSRAAKLDPKEMKSFAEVTTAHDDQTKKDGVARVKIPIDGKYHAYYVVNTSTPKEAMAKNSDPIVVITPISDDNGKYSPEFTVYPKSEAIPPTPNTPQTPTTNTPGSKQPEQQQQQPTAEAQQPHTVTEAKMYQTGRVNNFWNNIVSYFKGLFE